MNGHQYRVLVSGAGCLALTSTATVLIIPNQSVSGFVTYDNSTSAVIPFALVELNNTSTQQVISTMANAQGQYSFNAVPAGTYTLQSTSTLPWPRANATDALMVARHHSGILFLSGLRLDAADVNASSSVNSSDALQILQRGIRIINQFDAGDWVSEQSSVIVGSAGVNQNIRMLGYGDVNASAYTPIQRLSPPSFRLFNREVTAQEDYFVAQIRSSEAASLGALTLSMQLPEGVRVSAVRRIGLKGGQLEYHQEGRLLNIGWYQVHGTELSSNEVLFELVTNVDLSGIDSDWNLLAESEMADREGSVLNRARLDLVLPASSTFELMSVGLVYPNPSHGNAHIDLQLMHATELTLRIWDATGRMVQEPLAYRLSPGTHKLPVEGLAAGHYRIELIANDQMTQQQIYRHMVVVR
jgi:hypothetical protein